MPMRQSSSTVQPCSTARCPTLAPAPMTAGKPGSACTIVPSWMLLPAPMLMVSRSARSTAVYQTPAPAATVTAPASTASGAIHAAGSTDGRRPSTVKWFMASFPECLLWSHNADGRIATVQASRGAPATTGAL